MALAHGQSPALVAVPANAAIVVNLAPLWHHNPDESWYGSGFYGQRTACGQTLTKTLVGVANRTLPCGTLVMFRNPCGCGSSFRTADDAGQARACAH